MHRAPFLPLIRIAFITLIIIPDIFNYVNTKIHIINVKFKNINKTHNGDDER